MYRFHFTVFHIGIRFLEQGLVPEHKTSALRGGMGQQLLEMYCVGDKERCQECLCQRRCIVQNIIYAPFQIKPAYVTQGESAGYSISCTDSRTKVRAGEEIDVTLTLFGDTVAYINPVIQALFALGQKGLGREGVPFTVSSISNENGEPVLKDGQMYTSQILTETAWEYITKRKQTFSHGRKIKLHFFTPCTIKYQGKNQSEFEIEAILQNVHRRVLMQNLFEGIPVENLMCTHIPKVIGQHSELKKVKRYSGRTKEKMQLQGITGWLELDEVEEDILDLLLAGEITQIGKNIRFGFGRYSIEEIC